MPGAVAFCVLLLAISEWSFTYAAAVEVGKQTLSVRASIGLAVDARDGVDELVRRADVAMYAAKRTGAGAARHTPSMDDVAPMRITSEAA